LIHARQDKVRWPEWKYDATLGHAPAWHSKLLKAGGGATPRSKLWDFRNNGRINQLSWDANLIFFYQPYEDIALFFSEKGMGTN
jgi:hypothetical protein